MSDYNTIKDTLARYLKQVGGHTAIQLIPDFITAAETSIYRVVRIPPMENFTELTTTSDGYVTLPYDLLELKAVSVQSSSRLFELKQRPYAEIVDSIETGVPVFFARFGNRLLFRPAPDTQLTVRLYYYRQFTKLTADTPSNYFSEHAPDVIVYRALMEAVPFLEGVTQERVDFLLRNWKNRYEAGLKELELLKQSEYKGSRLSVR